MNTDGNNNMNYIGVDDMIFHKGADDGIYSGGFSVSSIMMKAGLSPIMTVNGSQTGGGSNEEEKVSDLFHDLVVPNWVLSYRQQPPFYGGEMVDEEDELEEDDEDENIEPEMEKEGGNKKGKREVKREDGSNVIDDELYDKLLELVMVHNSKVQKSKRRATRKATVDKEGKPTKPKATKKRKPKIVNGQ
jgi:hypothetical protein